MRTELQAMAELAAGLGAIQPMQQQPLGPKAIHVDTTFELIDVQRGLWAGQINGENVTGTFAGPYLQATQLGIPRHVRGYVHRQDPAGNLPASYYGNVTVTIGQKTNVSEWLMAYVQPSYVSPTAPVPPGVTPSRPHMMSLRGTPDGLGADAPADTSAGWTTGEKIAVAAAGVTVVGGLIYLVTRKPSRRRR